MERDGLRVVTKARPATELLAATVRPATRERLVTGHQVDIRDCGTSTPLRKNSPGLVPLRDKVEFLDTAHHQGRRSLVACSGPWTK